MFCLFLFLFNKYYEGYFFAGRVRLIYQFYELLEILTKHLGRFTIVYQALEGKCPTKEFVKKSKYFEDELLSRENVIGYTNFIFDEMIKCLNDYRKRMHLKIDQMCTEIEKAEREKTEKKKESQIRNRCFFNQ